MSVLNTERGGMKALLTFLLLGIVIVLAPRLWLKQTDEPTPSLESPDSTFTNFQPGMETQHSVERPHAPARQAPQPPLGEPSDASLARNLQEIHRLIEQGQEAEAEAKLDTVAQESVTDPEMRRYLSVLWNNLGALKAKTHGAAAGVRALETAVSLNPDDAQSRLNLTHAYWQLKDPALTRDFLERTIELAPEDPLPHLALADILYDRDDLTGARLHLEHATERASQHPDLHSYLTFVTAKVTRAEQAEQRFSTRKSSHFIVKYNGHEDAHVWDRVLDILEDAYREIGQKFGYFPPEPITVVLHTRQTFQRSTGSPAWADGLFDKLLGRIQIPTQGALTDQAWLTRVLRHEFVHALLHERMGGRLGAVPTWLNEGLAMQLAGDPWPDIDELVQGEVTLIPLTHLEGGWTTLPVSAATVAYLEGNSATLYLIDRYGMQKVREIIGQLAAGQPIAAAIKDRLFISYDDFQRRWVDNLNLRLKT